MNFSGLFFEIDDFNLTDKLLGKGHFGSVYIVENINDQKEYAAKIIKGDELVSGKEQQMLMQESIILNKLSHPLIVKFYGLNFHSFKEPTKLEPTIIMEYLPNGSLKDILEEEKKGNLIKEWTPTKKYICLLGISHAMKYLHKKGIIHRDLKPANILFDENYHPIICDFGLSRIFPQALSKSMIMTMTESIGTPIYMSPELLKGDDHYGASIDVYAFGIVAFQIISGLTMPFEEVNSFAILEKIKKGLRPTFNDKFTEKMKDLLSKCWSADINERPSFKEIFDILSSDFEYIKEEVDPLELNAFIDKMKSFHEIPDKIEKLELILKEKEKFIQSFNMLKENVNDISIYGISTFIFWLISIFYCMHVKKRMSNLLKIWSELEILILM